MYVVTPPPPSQALVDVISSSGWLLPALAAMELSQITLQAMWDDDSPLMQLPHVTRSRAAELKKGGVNTVFELLELDDADRRSRLAELSKKEYAELAIAANRYPAVDVSYAVQTPDALHEAELVTVDVQLERDTGDDDDDGGDDDEPGAKKAKGAAGASKAASKATTSTTTAADDEADGVELVCAPFYPTARAESWWLLIGDAGTKTLLTIKRVTLGKTARASLQFVAPAAGQHKLTLYAVCDSYVGCDQVSWCWRARCWCVSRKQNRSTNSKSKSVQHLKFKRKIERTQQQSTIHTEEHSIFPLSTFQ